LVGDLAILHIIKKQANTSHGQIQLIRETQLRTKYWNTFSATEDRNASGYQWTLYSSITNAAMDIMCNISGHISYAPFK
jgi:hypothetical protein